MMLGMVEVSNVSSITPRAKLGSDKHPTNAAQAAIFISGVPQGAGRLSIFTVIRFIGLSEEKARRACR